MKIKHLILAILGVTILLIFLLLHNQKTYQNQDTLGLNDDSSLFFPVVGVEDDGKEQDIKKEDGTIEKGQQKQQNNVEEAIDTVEEEKEPVVDINFTNQYVFYEFLLSEEDEVCVLSEITSYIMENQITDIQTLSIVENSIYQDDSNTEFLFTIGSIDNCKKVTYDSLNKTVTIETYSYPTVKELSSEVIEKLHDIQNEYPESLGKKYVYEEEEYERLADIIQDFYYNISFGNYEEAFQLLALTKISEYNNHFDYDYFHFKEDVKTLLIQTKSEGIEPIIQAYVNCGDYYLVKISFMPINSIDSNIKEKWITVFIDEKMKGSIFTEDLNCIDLWKSEYIK